MSELSYTVGSGNVYEDLGYADSQEMRVKAELVRQISRIMKEEKMTQNKASKMTGIAQGDLSNLLRGRFRGFSSDRIFKILLKLGQSIDINIYPAKKTPCINFASAA